MRYTLVDGQGNFGSVDGDPPAAYRYTEARLEALAESLMEDLERTRSTSSRTSTRRPTEPTVLPATYPNLLVNGSTGIAVGMATNIPPHNLGEVIDGVVWLIENTLMARHPRVARRGGNPQVAHTRASRSSRSCSSLIPGPDFPDRRHDRRPARHPRGLPDRPRLRSRCAPRPRSKRPRRAIASRSSSPRFRIR